MSDGSDALAYLVAGAAGGGFLFGYGLRLHGRVKMIESIPTSKVRSVALGLAEVSGFAMPSAAPLESPFCGAECVYFRYRVEERVGHGKNARWVTVTRGSSYAPFYVEDDTGRLLVDPLGAELHLDVDHRYSTGILGAFDEDFRRGLARMGIAAGGRTLRCSETFIAPHEPVYALGTVANDPSKTMGEDATACLVMGKGAHGPFCLSDKSEKDLLASLSWKMYGSLYGGPALTLVCLYLLMLYFGVFR